MSATIIPRSLFINLFAKKFPKHEYLESTHELMNQFYIEMQSEPGQCFLFPGDQSIYSLKCICCQRSITATGSIGQTLYHAPIAMLHHCDMIVTEDDATVDTPFEFDIASIPLVCTSSDSYFQAMNSYLETHTDKDLCSHKQNYRHHQFSFCEAVKVDMSKMNESHNNPKTRNSKHKENIAHTMSLVRGPF